jgi:hypothetical protein
VVKLVPRGVGARGTTNNKRTRPKDDPDREAVRRDYETSNLTMRELEDKHGIPRTTIGRWAKEWTRANFAAAVADTTVRILARGETKETKRRNPVTKQVAGIVLQTAEINAKVIKRHREDVRDLRELAMRLASELQQATMTKERLREFFDVISGIKDADDMAPATKAVLRQQFNEFMRLHNRVGTMHRLAETFARLQTMDRTAHDLDRKDAAKPPAEIPDTSNVTPEQAHDTWKAITSMAA